MNRTQGFTSPGRLFRPAIQYISEVAAAARDRSTSRPRSHYRDASLDDDEEDHGGSSGGSGAGADDYTVIEGGSSALRLPHEEHMRSVSPRPHRRGSSSGDDMMDLTLTPTRSIPLIDLSRSPSPYPQRRSAAQSEDEEDDGEIPISLRPLIRSRSQPAFRSRARGLGSIFQEGGIGNFLFGTWVGYQVYVSLLVFWVGGCGFGWLLLNRFIMLTGTYKFPFPMTTTFFQLAITHVLLVGWSSMTRACQRPLQKIGLRSVVAPATPGPSRSSASSSSSSSTTYRVGKSSILSALAVLVRPGTGGIAGGGLLEFDRKIALQVLPLAVVYTASVVLSTMSFAYVVLPVYLSARITTIPFSLLLTAFMTRTSHSISTLSSSLCAIFNLLVACIRPRERTPFDAVVSGVFSSFFVALFPILLLRTQRTLAGQQIPQGDLLASGATDDAFDSGVPGPEADGFAPVTAREETRAYYQTLHYTSLLSLALCGVVVLLCSGEVTNIRHNCYFLDVPWFWFLVASGSGFAFMVFLFLLLLVRATSPLAATFVAVPAQALHLALLGGKMPMYAWVGVSLCWVMSAWFALARRDEGRKWALGVGAGLGISGR